MARDGSDIPDSELDVLDALWRLQKGTVREVLGELHKARKRPAYTTVHTLLERLVDRGYVRASGEGRAHVYEPRISREVVTAGRLQGLVDRFAGGRAAPLVLQLVETHGLSADDIGRLRGLLSKLEEESRPRRRS
jgi:predicted transcriptional regulator